MKFDFNSIFNLEVFSKNVGMYVNKNLKRILLFLIGCMGVRIGMGLFMKSSMCAGWTCSVLSIALALMGIGFLVIFFGGLRKTGLETDGKSIWWNWLRPLHGIMYLVAAWLLFSGIRENKKIAGNVIIVDALIGLVAWKWFHFKNIMRM